MKKLANKIKYHSAIIFPFCVVIVLLKIDSSYGVFSKIAEEKINILIGVIASLIGIFLTVLTIYLSFPKTDVVRKRMKNTGHNHILISNICVGIIIFSIALLVWLFTAVYPLVIYLFCGGLINLIITGYYILALSNIP